MKQQRGRIAGHLEAWQQFVIKAWGTTVQLKAMDPGAFAHPLLGKQAAELFPDVMHGQKCLPPPPQAWEFGHGRLRDVLVKDGVDVLAAQIESCPHLVLWHGGELAQSDTYMQLWKRLVDGKLVLLMTVVGSFVEESLHLLLVPARLPYKENPAEALSSLLGWFVPIPRFSFEPVDACMVRFREERVLRTIEAHAELEEWLALCNREDAGLKSAAIDASGSSDSGEGSEESASSSRDGGNSDDEDSSDSEQSGSADARKRRQPSRAARPPTHHTRNRAARRAEAKAARKAALKAAQQAEAVHAAEAVAHAECSAKVLAVVMRSIRPGPVKRAGKKEDMWWETMRRYPPSRGGLPFYVQNMFLAPGVHLAQAWPPFAYVDEPWERSQHSERSRIAEPQLLPREFNISCECRMVDPQLHCHGKTGRDALLEMRKHRLPFPLELRNTEDRGFGVFARTDIPANSYIAEYTGEVVRNKEILNIEPHHMLMHWHYTFNKPEQGGRTGQRQAMIDGTHMGNVTRFINHSCDPNCIVVSVCQPHDLNETTRLLVVQTRYDVAAGEELTFSYSYEGHDSVDVDRIADQVKCFCGSCQCRGYMFPLMRGEVIKPINMGLRIARTTSGSQGAAPTATAATSNARGGGTSAVPARSVGATARAPLPQAPAQQRPPPHRADLHASVRVTTGSKAAPASAAARGSGGGAASSRRPVVEDMQNSVQRLLGAAPPFPSLAAPPIPPRKPPTPVIKEQENGPASKKPLPYVRAPSPIRQQTQPASLPTIGTKRPMLNTSALSGASNPYHACLTAHYAAKKRLAEASS